MHMDTNKMTTPQLATEAIAATNVAAGLPVYDSIVLLSGKKEAVIMHTGEEYRLKLTRQGKLILTK